MRTQILTSKCCKIYHLVQPGAVDNGGQVTGSVVGGFAQRRHVRVRHLSSNLIKFS